MICILELKKKKKTRSMNKVNEGSCVPQIDRDRSAQEICNDNLLHHVSVFVHQGHEHHSREPALCLPVSFLILRDDFFYSCIAIQKDEV